MAKLWAKILAIGVSCLAAGGIAYGTYYGLDPLIEEIVAENTPEPEEIPTVVKEMFSEYEITSCEELTDFSSDNAPYINSAYMASTSSSSKVFYYDLTTTDGFIKGAKLNFAIGIENNAVTHYQYIENISEHALGENMAESTPDLFVGYPDDSTVTAGTTYTYNGMKAAVDAALSDAAGR